MNAKVLETYQDTDQQFQQIFQEFSQVNLPAGFKNINKILVCGMGGSVLGPDLVRSVFDQYLKVPIIIRSDYFLPKWVDKQTLVVISSFSGNTEETISCYQAAQRRKLKIFVVATGGKLAQLKSSQFIYEPKYNYAQNPRFAIGYSIAIFISLFKKIKVLDFCGRKIKRNLNYFSKGKSKAQKIASEIKTKIPVIISAEHLSANAHIWQNQINETGKNFATYFNMPEICHHQFEGLSNPGNLNQNLIYILINSDLYHQRNQKRFKITKEILKQKKINFIEIKSRGENVWSESLYVLGISSYASLFLAEQNKIDPQPNPWVDYLKDKMNK